MEPSEGQLAAVEVVVEVPETVVVVNWHGCQFTAVLEVVPPVTVAVSVVDCPTMIMLPTDEFTVTVTVFVAFFFPPQPAASEAAIIPAAIYVKIVRTLIQPPPK